MGACGVLSNPRGKPHVDCVGAHERPRESPRETARGFADAHAGAHVGDRGSLDPSSPRRRPVWEPIWEPAGAHGTQYEVNVGTPWNPMGDRGRAPIDDSSVRGMYGSAMASIDMYLVLLIIK